MYANVIVDAAGLRQAFTYGVPPELGNAVHAGACVAVQFGGKEHVGYVLSLVEEPPGDVAEFKDIIAVIPNACSLTPSLLDIVSWMADYYVTSLSRAVRAIVPEAMSATITTTVKLVDASKASTLSPRQLKIIETLESMGGEADYDILKARSRVDGFATVLRQLAKKGDVEILRTLDFPKAKPRIVRGVKSAGEVELDALRRAPKQAAIIKELEQAGSPIRQSELLRRVQSTTSPIKSLVKKGIVEKVDICVYRKPFIDVGEPKRTFLDLTSRQQAALDVIVSGLRSNMPHTTLLFGVTASGKTEVYLQSIQKALEQGKTAIALMPEIALTAHLLETYRARFGDEVAILHSHLSIGERYDEWRRIEGGDAKVVIGARSAIFAPVRDLGIIVVDEEHEPSYKQERELRYNARTIAEELARRASASVVLGSATPAVETFYRAKSGEISLAVLPNRIDSRALPNVIIVDQRTEFGQGRLQIFSNRLREAIAERLGKREQVILFVNRRGYASFILCRSCGYIPRCPNCAVSFTYHIGPRILRCHHCNASQRAPSVCPNCGGHHIRQFGIGTERVEEEVRRVFPNASVIRMDRDTTSAKGAHFKLLNAFSKGEADILVGTQIVAKGLDFPNVTLVGVVSADTALHLPDFRSAERTFQLLTQVSGRAGRGDIPGEVIIQSFSPEHYAIQAASTQDYVSFYEQEIENRRELSYPPFSRLINVISADPIEESAEGNIRQFASEIASEISSDEVEILGPAPAPLAKLKGLYRWHVVIRYRGEVAIREIINRVYNRLPDSVTSNITLDVDPIT
ncbi:MAG: primosomal protein N', partial [Armatimonadota bacterium]|nr:primosomal protein N' [Armatimonadota bacterium]